MTIARSIMLALAVTLGAVLSPRWNPGRLHSDAPAACRALDVDEFVVEHNRNADLIRTLEAKPTIGVSGRMMKGRADGKLAMERPRNFKLELLGVRATEADIGSNDEEFGSGLIAMRKDLIGVIPMSLIPARLPLAISPIGLSRSGFETDHA